jgi:hypothetical protein
LKKSLVELYEEEKHWKSLSYEADSPHFVSKDTISHFLKLVDLVFQQAAIVIGNGAKPSISGFGVYWRVKAEMG